MELVEAVVGVAHVDVEHGEEVADEPHDVGVGEAAPPSVKLLVGGRPVVLRPTDERLAPAAGQDVEAEPAGVPTGGAAAHWEPAQGCSEFLAARQRKSETPPKNCESPLGAGFWK